MIKLLLLMILAHVVDDFVLQVHILSTLKQKSWWEKNAPDKRYEDDYIAALLAHSMSWSIMILLPAMILYENTPGWLLICAFFVNSAIHFFVDDAKANKKILSLCQDQFIHLFQIIITWITIVLTTIHA